MITLEALVQYAATASVSGGVAYLVGRQHGRDAEATDRSADEHRWNELCQTSEYPWGLPHGHPGHRCAPGRKVD